MQRHWEVHLVLDCHHTLCLALLHLPPGYHSLAQGCVPGQEAAADVHAALVMMPARFVSAGSIPC